MKEYPLVSIIAVNYNGREYLKDCFGSLYNLNYPKNKLEIIMVDNGSSDGSLEFMRKNFSQVKIIENNVNNYCRANNLGIKLAKGRFIALINNDIKLDKDWLIELIKVMGRDNSVGAVTSKVLFPDGRLQSTGHYEFPNFYWSDRGFKEEDKGQYNTLEEVSSISHCAALYRKKCLDGIGLLDEDFNMYVEDVDISIRAKQKGWRLIYVPGSIAHHKFHGSADEGLVDLCCEKNRLLLIAKHYPEKLGDALLGKGYFTVLNNKTELIKVLPYVFSKLIKHHNRETVISILHSLFGELNKILNIEKDYLIKKLDSLEESRADKDREISDLKDKIRQGLEFLSQKEQALQEKDALVSTLRDEIQRIYNSETYRFIARPTWRILEIIKHLKVKPKSIKRKRLLIIKPYYVKVEETEKALRYLREANLNASITLVANFLEQGYLRLLNNQDIDEKFLYSPNRNKLNGITLFKLFFKLGRMRFDEAIILMGNPTYHGYRKAKLLAAFSRAKKLKLYFVHTGNAQALNYFTYFAIIGRSIYSSFILFAILILFCIFIVIPLKIRKFFRR